MNNMQSAGPREMRCVIRQYPTADGLVCLVRRRTPYGVTRAYEVWRGRPAAQKWVFQTEQAALDFLARRWGLCY